MADTVGSNTVFNGGKMLVLDIWGISDATGEADVVKADASAFTKQDGSAVDHFVIREVAWNIQGYSAIRLQFDATTDDEALVLSGNGVKSYEDIGGLADPQSTGYTGDILLTSVGPAANATYNITLVLVKK